MSSSTQDCGYCKKAVPGYADHRMCIVKGYNCSVEKWTNALLSKDGVTTTKEGNRIIYRMFVDGQKVSTAVQKDTTVLEVSRRPCFEFATRAAWETAVQARQPKKSSWTYSSKTEATFPAGSYYIGDLCYALSDEIYDGVFGAEGYASGKYSNSTTHQSFLLNGTAAGDGCYTSSDGKEFGVDAGIIGICPVSLMVKNDGGYVYTFEEPVDCLFQDGLFTFRSGATELIIATGSDTDDY